MRCLTRNLFFLLVFSGCGGGGDDPTGPGGPSGPPAAPTLTSPTDGTTGVAAPVKLDFQVPPFTDSVKIHIAPTTEFYRLWITESLVDKGNREGGPSSWIDSDGYLEPGTLHYWRVEAYNKYGPGPWSAVWSFQTAGEPPLLPRAIILGPPHGTKDWPVFAKGSEFLGSFYLQGKAPRPCSEMGAGSGLVTEVEMNRSQRYVSETVCHAAGESAWGLTHPDFDWVHLRVSYHHMVPGWLGQKYQWRYRWVKGQEHGSWSTLWDLTLADQATDPDPSQNGG